MSFSLEQAFVLCYVVGCCDAPDPAPEVGVERGATLRDRDSLTL